MSGSGFIMPHQLSGLLPEEPILIALSGGADSVYLLHKLIPYANENGSKLFCAHLNHMIRGEDADKDEMFCISLCKNLGIPCYSKKVDVPALSQENGMSIEEAARNARYSFFFSLMSELGIKILATAHNANDNVETLIFNLSRGSGLGGMRGIAPSRTGESGNFIVIRPIIREKKEDIISYCAENSIEYVTDKTNFETEYTRNRIRHKVIPELLEISPALMENAWNLTESAREDLSFIEELADRFILDHGKTISCKDVCSCHRALSKRVVMKIFLRFAEKCGKDARLERDHVDAILELCKKAIPFSCISLPNGIRATIEVGDDNAPFLEFVTYDPSRREKKRHIASYEEKKVSLPIPDNGCELLLDFCGLTVSVKRITGGSMEISHSEKAFPNIYNPSTYLLLKFDKISGSVYLRQRKSKDTILRGKINKDLRDIMSEAHLPPQLRDLYPIVCMEDDSSEVVLGIPGICGAVRKGFGARHDYHDLLMVKVNV